ncbi:MAG: hypothetical protein ACF8GE_00215 [Phycisphaerales bacterium JB043]
MMPATPLQSLARVLTLCVLLSLTSAACDSGTEESEPGVETVSFTPGLAPGTTHQYAHVLSTENISTVPNAGTFAVNATVVRTFTLDVNALNDDGSAEVTLTLDAFRLHISQNATAIESLDSRNPPTQPRPTQQALLDLVGVSLDATLEPTGSVRSMRSILDAFPPDVSIPSQARSFYDDAWFRSAITSAWHVESDSTSLALGDTWTTSETNPFDGSTRININRTFELVDLDESEARIQGTSHAELEFTPDETTDLSEIEIEEQAFSLSLLWNRSIGAMDLYETEQFLTLRFVRGGMTTTSKRRLNTSLRRIIPDSPTSPEQQPENSQITR